MTRQQLERHQVWFYLGGILAGLAVGSAAPGLAPVGSGALAGAWAAPLLHVHPGAADPFARSFRDQRFMGAVLAGNFLIVPQAVWGLLALAPPDPMIRLGILLVLLVPCTDWFILHASRPGRHPPRDRDHAGHPAGADALLPLYLWLFMGEAFVEILAADRILTVFCC